MIDVESQVSNSRSFGPHLVPVCDSTSFSQNMSSSQVRSKVSKHEIVSAANFLVYLIKQSANNNYSDAKLELFSSTLVNLLRQRWNDRWFPDKPFKASGYRAIRVNRRMDPVLTQAAVASGLKSEDIHSTLPAEVTLWVDPGQVSYRIGENGGIHILYEYDAADPDKVWCGRPKPNLSSESKPAVLHPPQNTEDMEYLLDPRKAVSIEQLAAYLSQCQL